ncbi:MAG: SPOR domain-containing protein, partial [Candidatus Solibacter sp.]
DKYAEVLVEMAAAVGRRDRRVAWEAMAMARHSDVHHRVERVLDEARVLCLGLTRAHRVALALCALPVLYLVAAIRPARVYAQQALAPAAPAAVEFRPQAPAPTEMRPPAPVEAGPSAESATAAQDRLYELYLRADRLGSARAELEKRLAASAEAQEAKWQAQGQRSALLEQLNKQILILRAEIEDMSSELSPNHPSLKRAEASLAVLERNSDQARREAEVSRSSELRNALPISVLSSELQSIREQLAATERVMESVDREAQAVRSHMAATEQTLVAERRMHDAGISDGRTSGSSPTGSMAAAGLYSQVMAVSQDVALAMQQALRQRGFPVSLVPAGNLMRVLAGPYPDAPARQIARRDLEAAGFKPVPFQRD